MNMVNTFDSKYQDGWLFNNNKYCKNVASNYYFIHKLKEIKNNIFNKETPNLCDMGCGVGNVLIYANKFGYNSTGVELLENEYKKFHDNLNVIYGDFFEIDLSFLKNMDLVYMYRPIWDSDLSDKLINLIYENTKDDVILYYVDPHSNFHKEDKKWYKIYNNNMYLSIKK